MGHATGMDDDVENALVRLLAMEIGIHPRTVRRWQAGTSSHPATDYAIRAAMRSLRIELLCGGWVRSDRRGRV